MAGDATPLGVVRLCAQPPHETGKRVRHTRGHSANQRRLERTSKHRIAGKEKQDNTKNKQSQQRHQDAEAKRRGQRQS